MALKTVAMNADYVNWNEVEEGSTLSGFYKEIKESVKKGWDPTVYVASVEGDKLYGLGGKANLVRALKEVPVGSYVEITYRGKITLEKGDNAGSKCHQFEVAYDDERINPLYAGNTAAQVAEARQEVEYKREAAAESQQAPQEQQQAAAPALVAPQQPQQMFNAPAQQQQSAPAQQPAAPAAQATATPAAPTKPKRTAF